MTGASTPTGVDLKEMVYTLYAGTRDLCVLVTTIADLYRCEWQVELFFKWIKQHLRIEFFFGTSESGLI